MDWQTILWIALAIGAAAFVKWGIPYIKSKVDIEKLNKLLAEIKELVELAEKLFGTGNNDLKLSYILSEIKKFDFNISDEDLIKFIQDAMKALQQLLAKEGKEIPTNDEAVKEYKSVLKSGKEDTFEPYVLAASFKKIEEIAVKKVAPKAESKKAKIKEVKTEKKTTAKKTK